MISTIIRNDMQVVHGYINCTGEKECNPPGDSAFHPMPCITSRWCEVDYEYYRVGEKIIRGTVKHFRDNGAVALLKEICEDIETKGGK